MKKLLNNPFLPRTSVFSLVCSLMMCSAAYAQTCSDGVCTGNFTLDSLEAITEDIRNARKIVGDLTIGDGTAGTDLTNAHIADFAVDTITGNLTINRTQLTELDAFASLRLVGGNLDIGSDNNGEGNPMLGTLSGFGALDSIGGRLFMSRNTSLTTISGFESLESVGGTFGITNNFSLATISGFESLVRVDRVLNIAFSNALRSLPAFPALRSIGSRLTSSQRPLIIQGNGSLSACCALFPFLQDTPPPGYTLGGADRVTILANARGCRIAPQVRSDTRCLIEVSTTPSLRGLPAAGGSFAVDLTFHHGSPLYAASSGEGGFLTVPSSSSTSFTVTYPQNTAFAPRVDTLIITPTDDAFDVPPLRRIVIQHGTARAIIANVQINSLEDITPEIRNVQYIVGDLTIGDGSSGTDLTNADLAALQVDTITGNLRIERTKLRTLNAFNSLKHVGGDLRIGYEDRGNSMLGSVSGFNALIRVGGNLYVWHNADLETFSGFDMLETVGGIFGFYENGELSSVSGFGSLRDVGALFVFENNSLLTSLPDFPSLTGVGEVILNDNPMLGTLPSFDRLETVRGNLNIANLAVTSISGFPSLTTISGNLSIGRNSRLRSVSGFPSLTTIGSLNIGGAGGNPILETLSGFPALRNIGASTTSIVIIFNPMLASCCVAFPFLQTPLPPGYTIGSGQIGVFDNASGCNSAAEIRATTGCNLTINTDITLDSLEAITPAIRAATRIEGNLTIGDGEVGTDLTNAHLAELQVDTITGNLTINRTQLTELDAFSSLRHIGGSLDIGGTATIDGNRMMTSLSGFDTLESIGGRLYLEENDALATITAFDRLRSIGSRITSVVDPVFIRNNSMLSMCCGVFPFVQEPLPDGFTLGGNGRVTIVGNAPGCNLAAEVREIECYLTVTTTPALTELAQTGGIVTVNLTFHGATTGWRAELAAGGLSLSISGTNTTFTTPYPANNEAAPRIGTLTVTPVGSAYEPTYEFLVVQLGTDTEVHRGNLILDSAEAITTEIQAIKHLIGSISIGDGSEGNDIENSHLSSLSLETIVGSLTISSTTITELDAFSQLRYIKNSLNIGGFSPLEGNHMMTSMAGFDALERIEGRLYMEENDALTTITAFEALDSIGGELRIVYNDALEALPPFTSLRTVGDDIYINNHVLLSSVPGFSALDSIGGSLELAGNEKLASLPPFTSLRSIRKQLLITTNPELSSLPAFPELRSIGSGLRSGASPISISDNAMLSLCCSLFPFLQSPLPANYSLGGSGMADISNNEANCASLEELRATPSCLLEVSTTPSLRGLPAEAGTFTVNLTFLYSTTGFEASSLAGGFLTVPASGSSTSFTVSYAQNTAFAPRIDTLIIRPTGSGASVSPLRLVVIQRGTARAILGDVVLDSLEAITAEIREAQYILGNLIIGDGEAGRDITNAELARLQVEEITGYLAIRGTKLATLDAFSSLTTIGGYLDIGGLGEGNGNAMLRSVFGFGALDSIAGGLHLVSNAELTTVDAFSALRTIGGNLRIGGRTSSAGNTMLQSVSGFEKLRNITLQLYVSNNASLVSLPRFPALRSIASEVSSRFAPIRIERNATLTTCCAFLPFVQDTPPTGYTLGGNRTPSISGNATTCEDAAAITSAGACHNIIVSTTASNIQLSEARDTIEVLLASHISSAELIINVEGGASGWTATRNPDGALLTAVTASGNSGDALELTFSANTTASLRRDTVTLSTTGTGTPISRTLSLTQAAMGTIVGDVVLDSLEAITAAIRSATRIEGSLLIGDGEAGRDITNPELARLQVETITENLIIRGTKLIKLKNTFGSLRTVGDSLLINMNQLLDSISGFDMLTTVGTEWNIHENNRLKSISGFDRLESVGQSFYMFANEGLVSVSGFGSLTTVGGGSIPVRSPGLIITTHSNLTSLPSFVSLRTVEGVFRINANEALRSLPAFDNLERIGGYFQMVRMNRLETISAFGRLKSVGGNLNIDNHVALESLSGFDSLERVRGVLQLSGLTLAETISGFGELKNVEGEMAILSNNALREIPDFNKLDSVGALRIESPILQALPAFSALRISRGDLEITSNNSITSISGFASLTTVLGDLKIGDEDFVIFDKGNNSMREISGFNNLERVHGNLVINSNDALSSVSGFNMLSGIERSLLIADNGVIESLPAFPLLRSIGSDLSSDQSPIAITGNPMLSTCCGVLPFVQERLPDGYSLGGTSEATIMGNATGCDNVDEVRMATNCATSHTISLSTTTSEVEVGTESGGTIPISLPADGTEAVFTVALGIATGFTAEETSDDDNFVTLSASENTLTISYSANPGTTPRRATITLSTEGPGASITRTLSLTQRSTAAPTLSLTTSPSELTSLAADGRHYRGEHLRRRQCIGLDGDD